METLKKVYKIALKNWKYLVGSLIAMLIFTVFSGLSITMIVPILDYVFVDSPKDVTITTASEFLSQAQMIISQFLSEHSLFNLDHEILKTLGTQFEALCMKTDSYMLLWIISIGFVSIYLLKNTFFYLNRVFSLTLRGRTVYELRTSLFKKYLYQSMAFFQDNKTGDSLVRMISDIQIVSDQFIGSALAIMRNISLVIMYGYIAIAINSKLFLMILLILPGFGWLINFIGQKLKKYAKRQQGQYSTMFSYMEEVLSNMKVVKAFSKEHSEEDKFKGVSFKYYKLWRKSHLYTSFNIPISELSSAIMGAVLLIIGGKLVLDQATGFSIGNFMAFLFAIFSTMHPLKELTKAYSNIRKGLVSLDRIGEILNRDEDVTEIENPIRIDSFNKAITFEKTVFSYDKETDVLKAIDLKINKGERVALVGNSGSGKTTLVNLLLRFYDVTGGDIKIDGKSIHELAVDDLRSLYGYVTQESILFNATVAENISYGTLNGLSDEKIQEAAKIAYADEFIDTMQEGYKTEIAPKASNLSGGQKQRLCIARAVAGDPPILIFDEATSALDTESEQKVQQAIESATAHRTVIMIAHRLSTVISADKIVVMDKGNIVGIGKHDELLKTCDRYKMLYNMQFHAG